MNEFQNLKTEKRKPSKFIFFVKIGSLWMLFGNKISLGEIRRAAINNLFFPNNIQRCKLGMLAVSNCHHAIVMRRCVNRHFLGEI